MTLPFPDSEDGLVEKMVGSELLHSGKFLTLKCDTVELPDGIATVGDVRAWLRVRGGIWADTLAEGRALRMALNHVMTGAGTRVTEGCEVAFFPPVTGG